MIADAVHAPGRELEIKLTGAPDIIERAVRSAAVRALQQGRSRTRLLESVYFDTSDGHLQKRGLGLRLRRQGRRWIQTLKRERAVTGGLHDRDEIEHIIALRWPSFGLYDGTEFEEAFADADLRNLIQPVFTTSFRRTIRVLHQADTQIELAWDRGEIVAEGRHQTVCELELELKSGDPGTLFDLASNLCDAFALRLDNRSKAERGYALALDQAPAPAKSRVAALLPAQSSSHAFVLVAAEGLRHLQANEAGLIDGKDPEYVHQARVALRRLRAAISLFAPIVKCAPLDRLDADLRHLAQSLGTARDWDVFCLETLPQLPASLDIGSGLATLAAKAQTRRLQADRFAQEVVFHPRFTQLVLSTARALHFRPWEQVVGQADADTGDADLAAFARAALDRAWTRVGKRARRMNPQDPDSYHPLRIALKKLRYGGEYFASLFPGKATRQFLSDVAALQETLGRLNDAATILRLADALREDCQDADARETLGALRGYFSGRMSAALRPIDKEWKRIRRARPFWE